MKRLSLWGYENPNKTIAIIAILQTVLSAIAIYMGVWLFAQDVLVPTWVYYIGLSLFFLGLILYPIRRAAHPFWKMSYKRQKTMDAVLLVSYMFTAVAVANNDAHLAWRTPDAAPSATPVAVKWENTEEAKWYKKDFRKKVKQRFKAYVKAQKENGASDGLKFFGIFLLTLLLMAVITVLACSIACSGAEAIGLVVLIGGWALAIYLAVVLVRKVKGKRKAKYEPMPEPEPKG